MQNPQLYNGGDSGATPWDKLTAYVNKRDNIIISSMNNVRAGAVAPVAADLPLGKYTVWNNNGTVGIYYNTTGTVQSFSTGGGGTPGGSTTQVQYNNAGTFGGISGATTNGTVLTLVAPVLGTPTSGTLTNCTGLPISTGVAGLAAGVAAFLATPSSTNLITAVTDETGTGALVFATSPALVTPTLGVASATTVNKITITAPATSATLTLAQGSSLVTSGANSITFTSTGPTTVTLPTSGTLLAANQTITLSGDVSGSGTTAITTAIGANKVTLGMHATMAPGTVIGQSGTTTATPLAVTVPVLIASGTASAQATLDINLSTFNGLYLKYAVELYGFQPVTTGTTFRVQVSVDGTTFDGAASNYGWNLNFTMDSNALNGPLTNAADTAIQLTGTSGVGNGAAVAYNGTIQIFNPSVATLNPTVMFDSVYNNGTTNFRAVGNGTRLTTQLTKGIRLLFSSGNISTGKYRVYGYV